MHLGNATEMCGVEVGVQESKKTVSKSLLPASVPLFDVMPLLVRFSLALNPLV